MKKAESQLPWLAAACSLLALSWILAATSAWPSNPPSATLTLPTVGQPGSVTWAGGPLTNPNPGGAPVVCVQGTTCDTFTLTLNIPADAWSSNRVGILDVQINWVNATPNDPAGLLDNNDLDLFVIDPNGNTVARATAGFTQSEETFVFNPIPGVYRIRTVAFNAYNQTFTGTATLSIQPPDQLHFSPNTHLIPGKFQSLDAEPAIRADAAGNIYVSTNRGLGGGIDAWKILFPKTAASPAVTYLGQPDGGRAGGGDTDMAVAPAANSSGFFNVYMSSLTLASVTLATTQDGGAHFAQNFFSSTVPCVDRQWNAADGAQTVFMSYHDVCNGNNILVVRSDDAGAHFAQVALALDPAHIGGAVPFKNWLGNIASDHTNHFVYQPFVSAGETTDPTLLTNFNSAFMAVSTDGGRTFTDYPVFTAAETSHLANDFPAVAVDSTGNVYMAWVENNHTTNTQTLFFTSSIDHGQHWTLPVRVNQVATAMLPWIVAGCSGRVDVLFYGTTAPNRNDQNADWQVFFAQTLNGTSTTPSFAQTLVSDRIVLHGPFDRRVLDDIQIDIDPTDGMAVVAYTGGTDRNTYFSKQIQGPSALACR
jgi:hypothetical protein